MTYGVKTTEPAGVFACPSAQGKLEGADTEGGLNNTAATTHYGLGLNVGHWSSITESTSEDDKKKYAKKVSQYRYHSKVMALGEKQWGLRTAYRLAPGGSSQPGTNIFDGMIRHEAYANYLFMDFHLENRKPNQVPGSLAGKLYPANCTSGSVVKNAFWAYLNHIDEWPGISQSHRRMAGHVLNHIFSDRER